MSSSVEATTQSSADKHAYDKSSSSPSPSARPVKRLRSQATIPIWNVRKNMKEIDIIDKEFLKLWETFQVVHLPRRDAKEGEGGGERSPFAWKDIHGLFSKISNKDQESFCIETASKTSRQHDDSETYKKGEPLSYPEKYFQVQTYEHSNRDDDTLKRSQEKQMPSTPYYCSFLVQKDVLALNDLLSKVPIASITKKWYHEPCVWVFFGRNPDDDDKAKDLQGRPEHTDSISHDGTWHYQLSGTKRWLLRPTRKLLEQWKDSDSMKDWNNETRVEVNCRQGDVLVINTRLWFHQTILPPQIEPSVSYARDFWAQQTKPKSATGDEKDHESTNGEEACMTNLDGLYATDDIEPGTILIRETDMPDCELHRSKENPNCEVVELEDGTSALVACRPITAGEFFCVAESDEDQDFDEEEDFDEKEGDGGDEE